MKKFLLLIFIFLIFPQYVMALDLNKAKEFANSALAQTVGVDVNSNFKQQKAEKEWKNKLRTEQMLMNMHFASISDDYKSYKYEQNKETIYARVLEFTKGTLYSLDMQYAEKAKTLIEKIVIIDPDSNFSPEDFDKIKIIILDKDFDKINSDLREIILMINSY